MMKYFFIWLGNFIWGAFLFILYVSVFAALSALIVSIITGYIGINITFFEMFIISYAALLLLALLKMFIVSIN